MDMESDHETITVTSLFGTETFSSPQEMLDHCKKDHGFDFLKVVKALSLDFHGAIKLVNLIRSRVRSGQAVTEDISAEDLADDQYLKPVLENDALLFSLDEVLEGEAGPENQAVTSEELQQRNKTLESELEALQSQFANYRLAVEQTLDKRWGDENTPGPSTVPKKDNSNYYFESYAEHGECPHSSFSLLSLTSYNRDP